MDGDGPTEDRAMTEALTIDCDSCVMRHTSACDDCVVTFICNREPDEAVIIDVAEERALGRLIKSGLVPQLRHAPGRGEVSSA
jgi:hypothetical protein